MTDYLRSCTGCPAHLLVGTDVGRNAYCSRCRAKLPTFDEWAQCIAPGSRVYVQPSALPERWRACTEHVVIERDGDEVTVQPLGSPGERLVTTIAQLGREPMVVRR